MTPAKIRRWQIWYDSAANRYRPIAIIIMRENMVEADGVCDTWHIVDALHKRSEKRIIDNTFPGGPEQRIVNGVETNKGYKGKDIGKGHLIAEQKAPVITQPMLKLIEKAEEFPGRSIVLALVARSGNVVNRACEIALDCGVEGVDLRSKISSDSLLTICWETRSQSTGTVTFPV